MRLESSLKGQVPLKTLGLVRHPLCCRGSGHTHRTTPNIRLLDSRKARGSTGSEMRSHSLVMSAVRTDFLGSFLNADLDPRVAANLDGHL